MAALLGVDVRLLTAFPTARGLARHMQQAAGAMIGQVSPCNLTCGGPVSAWASLRTMSALQKILQQAEHSPHYLLVPYTPQATNQIWLIGGWYWYLIGVSVRNLADDVVVCRSKAVLPTMATQQAGCACRTLSGLTGLRRAQSVHSWLAWALRPQRLVCPNQNVTNASSWSLSMLTAPASTCHLQQQTLLSAWSSLQTLL